MLVWFLLYFTTLGFHHQFSPSHLQIRNILLVWLAPDRPELP